MIKDLRHADYFLFTQQSLTTFDNCPLKFKKRYIENLKWDSLPDENIRKRLEIGNDFHLLAYRYFMGIDTGLDRSVEGNSELKRWIDSLKIHFPIRKDVVYLPEYKLRMAEGSLKLEANFDLLVVGHDSIEIWDWKTHSNKFRSRKALEANKLSESLQTKVYLYVLREQICLVTGNEQGAEKINMRYWQPDPPEVISEIKYNGSKHEEFKILLEKKINTILEFDYSEFNRNLYINHCKFCEFNWFCNNTRVDFSAIEENGDY